MRNRPILIVVVALALTLSACSFGATSTKTDAASTSSPTPVPTKPTPTMDPADPANWVVSAQGIGPVRLGQSLTSAVAAAAPYVAVPTTCPNPGTAFLGPLGATEGNTPLLIAADGQGVVYSVAISDVPLKTVAGIGVGSSRADVLAAYPDATGSTPNLGYPDNQWTVRGNPGWITFGSTLGSDDQTIRYVSVNTASLPPSEYCG